MLCSGNNLDKTYSRIVCVLLIIYCIVYILFLMLEKPLIYLSNTLHKEDIFFQKIPVYGL